MEGGGAAQSSSAYAYPDHNENLIHGRLQPKAGPSTTSFGSIAAYAAEEVRRSMEEDGVEEERGAGAAAPPPPPSSSFTQGRRGGGSAKAPLPRKASKAALQRTPSGAPYTTHLTTPHAVPQPREVGGTPRGVAPTTITPQQQDAPRGVPPDGDGGGVALSRGQSYAIRKAALEQAGLLKGQPQRGEGGEDGGSRLSPLHDVSSRRLALLEARLAATLLHADAAVQRVSSTIQGGWEGGGGGVGGRGGLAPPPSGRDAQGLGPQDLSLRISAFLATRAALPLSRVVKM